MKKYLYITIFSLLLAFPACTDDIILTDDAEGIEGEVKYRFMAEIGDVTATRVSIEPYDHNHGGEHNHDLMLHWEEDDVVELEALGTALKYNFVAKKYVRRADGTIEPFTSSTVVNDDDKEVIFFEYSGSADIENASDFSGTATCRPVELDEGKSLTQEAPNSALHLRHCELLTARLNNIDLTSTAAAWTESGVQKPVVFSHASEYAYLKIETNNFRYPIGGNGEIFIYDMDEESTDENYRNSEYFTPLVSMKFGESGSTFISVPEPGADGTTSDDFDSYTNHYLHGSQITCDFYVPLPETTIQAGHYLAAVVQCGSSGDLYVFEKKVPLEMKLQPGYLYTLDYTDRKPEYALCVIKNLTYLRSTFLGQNFEGEGATAPRYNLKGKEVTIGCSVHNSNRFSEQDAAECGDDYLTAAEVKEMRNNHGAYYISGNANKYNWDGRSGGSEMVSISPIRKAYWERWPEKDGDGGAWKFYNDGSATDASGVPYTSGTRKIVLTDTLTTVDYKDTEDYMKKITKGVVNKESDYHVGIYTNSYEYVLKDKFDAVIKQGKTSLLWRTPYSRDVVLPFSSYSSKMRVTVFKNSVLAIKNTTSSHSITLPFLKEYYEDKAVKSTRFDGSGASNGTWKERALTNSLSTFRIFGSRSIRSLGGNNPAYFQVISVAVNYSGSFSSSFCTSLNFDIALPVLPVFRWHRIQEDNKLLPWE